LSGERCIDDILKGPGNLYCIFSFLRADKVDSMLNISRRKLGWASSNSFWEVRAVLRAKSADGGMAYTSRELNMGGGMASIKLRKDIVNLNRREGFHGLLKKIVMVYLFNVELFVIT
jgi:hypothetical protein